MTATLKASETNQVVRPEIGQLYRHAETGNLLYVVGKRASAFDVFDLGTNKHLVLQPASLVAEETDALTAELLTGFAIWFSAHRTATRKVAVREYKADRWCMDGLNQALRDLGMAPYEPTLNGTVTVRVPFEVEDSSTPRSAIERAVNDTLAAADFAQTIRGVSINGVALEADAVSVRASDFHRR